MYIVLNTGFTELVSLQSWLLAPNLSTTGCGLIVPAHLDKGPQPVVDKLGAKSQLCKDTSSVKPVLRTIYI